jgi:hypothetical protein
MKYISKVYIENCSCQIAGIESGPKPTAVLSMRPGEKILPIIEDEFSLKNKIYKDNINKAGINVELDKYTKKEK